MPVIAGECGGKVELPAQGLTSCPDTNIDLGSGKMS
jgi:hypothetical protein